MRSSPGRPFRTTTYSTSPLTSSTPTASISARFNPDGTAKTPVDEHANELVHVLDPAQNPRYTWPQDQAFYGNQMHPAVSMDADGDFAIAWDGPGTDTTDPATVSDVAA